MILIVADTGPINYLIQIGCVNVLSELVKTVALPASVLRELQSEGAPAEVPDGPRICRSGLRSRIRFR